MANLDRLQFVKHEEIFATREEAVNYVLNIQSFERPSLLAEPMILLYESENTDKGPNVILAVGSVGNGTTPSNANRTFFIDTQKTEDEIEELRELIEESIKSISIIPVSSNTVNLSAEETEDGTILSGDVKIADYRIISGNVLENIIETEGDKGIYTFVDMDYDPESYVITFKTTKQTKEFQIPSDQHVISGWYNASDETIYLKLADNSEIKIDVVKLIDEWKVLSGASTTPICLYKQHVSSSTESHSGIYDWQDVLWGDVRVADHFEDNILHKDGTGEYLYVKGTADNIKYKNNQTVADALDNIDTNVSTSEGNLIYKRPDGIYAYAMLGYNTAENKITYTYSDGNEEGNKTIEFQLNSVKIIDDITYDPANEVIVIRYIDAQGEYQRVEIPAKDIIEEWIVSNDGHNVELNKYRNEDQGKDILTADVKIYGLDEDNNILDDKNHRLYVNGIADNIKYDTVGNTTVKNKLDALNSNAEILNEKINQEIDDRISNIERIDSTIGSGFTTDSHETVAYKFEQLSDKVNLEANKLHEEIERSIAKDEENETAIANEITRADAAEQVLTDKIGSGFTDDPHDNVTAKFDEIQNKVNSEADKLQNEIDRSISADTQHNGRLDAIDAEIGDGFGPRNTVRDEIDNLQVEINAVSADSANSIKDVINNDHSIDIDKTSTIEPVIKVNLSADEEDGKPNIIKLNNDGLYAGVDLSYEKTANKLIFKTTNDTKEIQLEGMSSIISIEYNPTKESIVITYMANGHEIKTVEIPLGDLINEWRVEDGHPHAVQLEKVRMASGTTEQDVLKASVIITESHDDNILVIDDGALYVSGAQIESNKAAIEQLQSSLSDEISRAEAAETTLSNDLASEVNRAVNSENVLSAQISQETANRISDVNDEETRATAAELALSNSINSEITRASGAESILDGKIDNEERRAINEENSLRSSITAEVTRATAAESNLQTADNVLAANLANEISRAMAAESDLQAEDSTLLANISNEVSRAMAAEAAIQTQVDANKLEFHDTTTIDLVRSEGNPDTIVGHVKIATADNNIIKADDSSYGIYASVDLSYDSGTNILTFKASDGTNKDIALSSGSVINRAWFDPTTEELVLEFLNPDGTSYEVRIPVGSLFNEWDVDNLRSSAITLEKIEGTESGSTDLLTAKVNVSQANDNILVIRDNHLYVSGSGITKSLSDNEAISGNLETLLATLNGPNSQSYDYPSHENSNFISAATSYDEADMLLDAALYEASTNFDCGEYSDGEIVPIDYDN